jgi:diamine N-acetyltransferase
MFEGRNIYLRALEPQDVDLLYQWENNVSLWYVSNTLTPFSRFAIEQYVMNSFQDIYTAKQLRMMIIKADDLIPIGTIDLFDFDPFHKRAGLGIMILEEFRTRGFASETLEIMKSYCFNTLLLHQIYCNIAEDNVRSLELFKKSGFELCGRKKHWLLDKNQWKDEFILQYINQLI